MDDQQKYPEGRERLLALAETPPTSRSIQQSPFSKNFLEFPAKRYRKPKMGLKDDRYSRTNRPASAMYSGHSAPTPSPVLQTSFQEKVSHALKNLKPAKQPKGSVAANDVVYYPAYDLPSNLASNQNFRLHANYDKGRHFENGGARKILKFENANLGIGENAPKSPAKVDSSPVNQKIQNYSNPHVQMRNNLENAKRTFKSSPDFIAANEKNQPCDSQLRRNFSAESQDNNDDLVSIQTGTGLAQATYPCLIIDSDQELNNNNLTTLDGSLEDCSRVTMSHNKISIELRNTCGSPTDSGYRSVPREMLPNFNGSFGSTKSGTSADGKCAAQARNCGASVSSVLIDSSPDGASSKPKFFHGAMSRGSSTRGKICSNDVEFKVDSPKKCRMQNCRQNSASAATGSGGSPVRHSKLVQLAFDQVPWSEKDLVQTLQKGRCKDHVNFIAVDVVPYLAHFLQRPLVRLARQMQRLSSTFHKCTKREAFGAAKIILPMGIDEICIKAAQQSSDFFDLGHENLKQSESRRANLNLSVGKFYRWMLDSKISACIYESAAVFFTGIIEALLNELVIQSVDYCSKIKVENQAAKVSMLTANRLVDALESNWLLWGLFQPYEHLMSYRNADGVLHLPPSIEHQIIEKAGRCEQNAESFLLATCIDSVEALSDLILKIMASPLLTNETKAPSPKQPCGPIFWHPQTTRALFQFMRCSQLDISSSNIRPISLQSERLYAILPPLVEWVKVSVANCQCRCDVMVSPYDVMQAAAVLLPSADYSAVLNPHWFNLSVNRFKNVDQHRIDLMMRFEQAEKLLATCQSDNMAHAINLMGFQDINSCDHEGLSLLMTAAHRGNEPAVLRLLDAGADVDLTVAGAPSTAPSADFLAGWSALTFAVASKHTALVRLLLGRGSSTELASMVSETPLQLAAMRGDCEIVTLLQNHGSDPFYYMAHSAASSCCVLRRGCPAPIVLAASHGRRDVVQLFLARRRPRSDDVISLEEFLAEAGSPIGQTISPPRTAPSREPAPPSRHPSEPSSESPTWFDRLPKAKQRIVQEAAYYAAEHGFVDIVMDMRNAGFPWNLHIWSQTLVFAQEKRRKALVQVLLKDFVQYKLSDCSLEFIEDCCPLLFDILKQSKNEVAAFQVCGILSQLYGADPDVPPPDWSSTAPSFSPRIDPKFVNNPEMSDVKFSICGLPFYAHRIVLVNAPRKFRRFLRLDDVRSDDEDFLSVDDVDYEVFQMAMEHLYSGKLSGQSCDINRLVQLLKISHKFELNHLKFETEKFLSEHISIETCADIYKDAKQKCPLPTHLPARYGRAHSSLLSRTPPPDTRRPCRIFHVSFYVQESGCTNLSSFCRGYFLRNLPALLSESETFRKLLYPPHSNVSENADFLSELLSTLTNRLLTKLKEK